MAGKDVAITGIGLVTPAGIGVDATWERVVAGDSTADHDPTLAGNPITISCRVPCFVATGVLTRRKARRLDRFVQFAVVAAEEALLDARLCPSRWDGARVGIVLGCADGGPLTVERQYHVMLTESPAQVSPLLLPMQLPNMLAGNLSIELGATGPSMVVATACASGATAIGMARDLLTLDRCDIVVTGGSEAMVTPLVMAGYAQMGALSRRQDDPKTASRPFDADRDGFVASEGAGILVLERPRDALARGARIHGLIKGSGISADAHHITAPDPGGRGFEIAVRAALADAGVGPADIGHVNAHGTSTPLNDLTESRALHRVFGSRALVTSTKGVTGHMFGAAGAVEAVLTVLAMQKGVVPPTANVSRVDPEVPVPVAVEPTPLPGELALSTSLGFGGQNAALVLAVPSTMDVPIGG
jgi:3-oxoacyl-[acyl-carrier-protein] synthase II